MLLIIILSIIAFLFVFIGILYFISPGKPEPFMDSKCKPVPGSISEKVFVNIGRVKHGMFIRGKGTRIPVLLYIHGEGCCTA